MTAPIYTVSEISLNLKNTIETNFAAIAVKGEVFGAKKAESGHIYFSLKDSESVLSAICWRGCDKETFNAIQEGLEIVAYGKLSSYPGRSTYQMIVSKAEPAGIGALLKLLNERKEALAKEGLFDLVRKKAIPFLPKKIGVITSPTGAVIRDIIHRISDRFPCHLLVWPVLVQGEEAPKQIIAAIQGFNNLDTQSDLKPDVLIIARGGGSFEDLWCFNDADLVRAVANSKIPTISAVGHETDTTLIDYASDLRAPTPTGAAEKAVPVLLELSVAIENISIRLKEAIYMQLTQKQNDLKILAMNLPKLEDIIHIYSQNFDDKAERLKNSMHMIIQSYTQPLNDKIERLKNTIPFVFNRYKENLNTLSLLLESFSYTNILNRGFAFITNKQKKLIDSKEKIEKNMVIHFKNGAILVEVAPIKKEKIKESAQGDLFL